MILLLFFKLTDTWHIYLLSSVNSAVVLNGKNYRYILLIFFPLFIYIFF